MLSILRRRQRAGAHGGKPALDPVTGLALEDEGLRVIEREVAAAGHHGRAVSVALMELQHLDEALAGKAPAVGRRVYEEVGAVLRDEMRSGDSVARWDAPNRFLIVLPGAEREIAAHVARRLEQAIRRVLVANMLEKPVTVCVGTAISGDDGRSAGALTKAAAEMMVYARRLGGGVYASSRDTALVEELTDDDSTEVSYIATSVAIRSLLGTLESHAPGIAAHGRRVAAYVIALARAIGFPEDDMPLLKAAALLHDVGMLGVPVGIIEKRGKLTSPEYQVVRRHPDIGYQLLRGAPWLQTAATFVRYHHERYGGHGYPEGLEGQEIPLGSRLIAVAEAFDALTTARPYRRATTRATALVALEEGAGTQFDPEVVAALRRLVEGRFRPRLKAVEFDFPGRSRMKAEPGRRRGAARAQARRAPSG